MKIWSKLVDIFWVNLETLLPEIPDPGKQFWFFLNFTIRNNCQVLKINITLFIHHRLYTHTYTYIKIQCHICYWYHFWSMGSKHCNIDWKFCELQDSAILKINLIWLHSMKISWSAFELFSLPSCLCVCIYIYIYIYSCCRSKERIRIYF